MNYLRAIEGLLKRIGTERVELELLSHNISQLLRKVKPLKIYAQ